MKTQIITGVAVCIISLFGVYVVINQTNDTELQTTEVVVAGSAVVQSSEVASITGEVWADNWFSLYVDGVLAAEDSVSITTERSFNQETFTFEGAYPMQLAFVIKDFKENDTGLEYIGANNQQMGDGGFIAQFTDTATGEIVGVTNESVVCTVIHTAPLDKSCENEQNPVAGVAPCTFESLSEPDGWTSVEFDDSTWTSATVYSEAAVSPKDGYNEIDWTSGAKLIWGDDLEQVNTLLCRMTLAG